MDLKKIINSNSRFSEIIRFGLVGAIATAMQYGFYVTLVHVFDVKAVPSTMISYALSFIGNFLLSSYFTFHTRPNAKKGLGFTLSHLLNMGLQTGLVAIFQQLVGETLALLPALAFCIPVNYLLVRFAFTSKLFSGSSNSTRQLRQSSLLQNEETLINNQQTSSNKQQLSTTNMTKIAMAADHAGYDLKEIIKPYLRSKGFEVIDFGTNSSESCDYADYAHPAARSVESGECAFGVAMCGSGNGIQITLNKHQKIRAALCWLPELASLAKQHNNANFLVMPARFITPENAKEIVDAYLAAEFEGGRHQRRIDKIPV